MATYIHTVKTNATQLVILYENLLTWQAFGTKYVFKITYAYPICIYKKLLIKTIMNQINIGRFKN